MSRRSVNDPGDVPDFGTDDEEREFWRTHTFGDKIWAKAKHMTPFEALGLTTAESKERAKPPETSQRD